MLDEFDNFLTDISRCFIQRDLPLWRSRLILPLSIVTKTGPIVLADDEAVARNFALYLKASEIMDLDFVDRSAIAIEDCNDGSWLGTFQTRLLSKNILATAPYTSTALLQLVESRFCMSSMLNGRGHSEWTRVKGR